MEKTPLCRVLLQAYQILPPNTAVAAWPLRAVELARLRQPYWEEVDALSNLGILKGIELESHFKYGSSNATASPEERERYWEEKRSMVQAEIKAGKQRLYRTVDIPLTSTQAATPRTVATIYRAVREEGSVGTISNPDSSTHSLVRFAKYYVTSTGIWSGPGRGLIDMYGANTAIIATDKLYAVSDDGSVFELFARAPDRRNETLVFSWELCELPVLGQSSH